jgi:hypothetical protein
MSEDRIQKTEGRRQKTGDRSKEVRSREVRRKKK